MQFQVRAYAGLKRVRVSVVVENCWDTWAGNIRYDAAVTVGGKQVFAAKAVDHHCLARWRKVFWWGGEENARLSKPGLTNYGGGYSYSARAAVICGIDGGFPKARQALE